MFPLPLKSLGHVFRHFATLEVLQSCRHPASARVAFAPSVEEWEHRVADNNLFNKIKWYTCSHPGQDFFLVRDIRNLSKSHIELRIARIALWFPARSVQSSRHTTNMPKHLD